MGKYERDWVEKAEQGVSSAFNGEHANSYDKDIAQKIKSKLNEKGISFTHSKWSGGGDYSDAGDINIYNNEKVQIGVELKFSKSTGKGTKANLGQNKFHEYIDTIDGYAKYDEDLGLKAKRYKKVEERLGIEIKNKAEYEKKLREIKKEDKKFIKEIAKIAEVGAIKYASYIKNEGSKHLKEINLLVEDILNSKHVKSSTSEKEILYCVVTNYQNQNQDVSFVNFEDIDSTITKIEAEGKSIKLLNKSSNVVLRFSVNWKNICQGGATPSFNVFV